MGAIIIQTSPTSLVSFGEDPGKNPANSDIPRHPLCLHLELRVPSAYGTVRENNVCLTSPCHSPPQQFPPRDAEMLKENVSKPLQSPRLSSVLYETPMAQIGPWFPSLSRINKVH